MGRDVDEARDVRVEARFGNDRSAVTMTDEDAGPILLLQDAFGRGHIFIQAGQRVLDHRHLVTVPNEDIVNGPPAGAVDEGAMHENDALHRSCVRRGRRCAEQ